MHARDRRSHLAPPGQAALHGEGDGPGPVEYLTGAFADARFVNVIRDPRGVVDSLLRVPFWRDTYRLDSPAWSGGLTGEDMEAWRQRGRHARGARRHPVGNVLRLGREEAREFAPGRYLELRYEDFVADPHAALRRLFEFSELADAAEAHSFIDDRIEVRDLTAGWRKRLAAGDVAELERLLGEPMAELGYALDYGRTTCTLSTWVEHPDGAGQAIAGLW